MRRVLGIPGLICVGLGTMLGGIFTTIGVGTQTAGPGVIGAFVLSGLACVFVSLCYAELASMVPIAGSAYTYAYATLGEFIAWIIGWDLILEYGISVAPVAASWSGYAQSYLANYHVALPQWARVANLVFANGRVDVAHSQIDVLAIAIVLVIAALIAVGIKESASVNNALVLVQVAAIGVFVVALFGAIHASNFVPALPRGFGALVSAAGSVFFAYIGFDTVTVASEEAKRPQRDVPLAVIGSLAIGGVLYVAISYVTVGVVPWEHIDPNAGMADAVAKAHANWLVTAIVFAGAMAGTTTVMLTSLLGQVRIFYVMSRDRMLPPIVAHVDPRTRTPLFTTVVTGVLVSILSGIIPLAVLLDLTNIGTLAAFTIVCVGVLVLRYVNPKAIRPFRSPLFPAVPISGAGLCLYLIANLQGATRLRFVGWFLAGAVVYALYGYRKSLLRSQPAIERDLPA